MYQVEHTIQPLTVNGYKEKPRLLQCYDSSQVQKGRKIYIYIFYIHTHKEQNKDQIAFKENKVYTTPNYNIKRSV